MYSLSYVCFIAIDFIHHSKKAGFGIETYLMAMMGEYMYSSSSSHHQPSQLARKEKACN
jgi:hypothetical protein